LVANVAIIVVAVLLGTVVVKRLIMARPAPGGRLAAAQAESVKPGTKISLPGFDWSRKDTNVVLVLQKGCHFCSESAPFYQRLARAASDRDDLRLVAALPQSEGEARQYLNALQVPLGEVRQTDLASIGVRGTPTLLLVDKTGVITGEWIGRLPPDKESEVLNRLRMKL
jgi:hypothetical protein